jgi:hypothetical protein
MPTIDRSTLDEAAARGIVSASQAERLWTFLSERADVPSGSTPVPDRGPRFTFTNVLYYLGAMVAIVAMSLFMTLGWEGFGGWGLSVVALCYMAAALAVALRLEERGIAVPAGILATLVVVLAPLAVWGVQKALGFWPEEGPAAHYRDYHQVVDGRWFAMELATLFTGVAMLRRFKAPFLVMPIAVTLWYMSMDLGIWFFPRGSDPWTGAALTYRQWFSVASGLLILAVAFRVDVRSRFTRDYAFWLYLFGLATFWGGLTSLDSERISGKLVYIALNVGLVLLGAALVRRVFTVFGALGVAVGLGSLGHQFFRDSVLFPFALTAIGLALVGFGVWWSRNEARVSARMAALLPPEVGELVASRRRAL